jgi:hypothetical protein
VLVAGGREVVFRTHDLHARHGRRREARPRLPPHRPSAAVNMTNAGMTASFVRQSAARDGSACKLVMERFVRCGRCSQVGLLGPKLARCVPDP